MKCPFDTVDEHKLRLMQWCMSNTCDKLLCDRDTILLISRHSENVRPRDHFIKSCKSLGLTVSDIADYLAVTPDTIRKALKR